MHSTDHLVHIEPETVVLVMALDKMSSTRRGAILLNRSYIDPDQLLWRSDAALLRMGKE